MALLAANAHAGTRIKRTAPPTLTFSTSVTQLQVGSSATLSWSSTNATSCSASGAWSGSKSTSGTSAASPTQSGNYTYTLSCTGSSGSVTQSVSLFATTFLDQQINAAQATATNTSPTSSCGAISQNASGSNDGFYWEIGDQNGIKADNNLGLTASGSVQPAGAGPYNYTRTTSLLVASASKWLYGSYVAETKAQYVNNQWQIPSAYVPFLNFTSGYNNMTDYCPYTLTPTVGACAQALNAATPSVPNDTQTAANVGKFYYNSGHLEVFQAGYDPSVSGVMNGANDTLTSLGNEVMAAFGNKGVAMNLNYVTPIPAGGVETTPGDYASFLQGLVRTSNPLNMRSLLRPTASDPYAVCTNPYDSTCVNSSGQPAAVFAPVPGNISWHYSITHWIEDDAVTGDGAYSSPGKFGFYPWVDSSKTFYGIVARYDTAVGTTATVSPYYMSVVCGQAIRKAFLTGVAQP